ncbi:MAG: dihydrolipoamide acetyltransferase family protein [Oceanococcus sp.]
MSIHTFKLPDIGEGIAEAEIAEWKVAVGDVVSEDQPLCDMLTDKAAVEIPSPVAGTVKTLMGKAGEMVAVGGALLEIETDADAVVPATETGTVKGNSPAPQAVVEVAPAQQAATEKPRLSKPAAVTGQASLRMHLDGHKPLASPAVRKRARDLGVDLRDVAGTGPQQRITHADLDQWQVKGAAPAPQRAATPVTSAADGVEQIPIIGLRRKIAQAMQQTKQRIPHFAYVEEVDVTELEALRLHLNAHRDESQAKLTMLPFLMRALVKVMPEFPRMNARYDDELGVLNRYDAVHVGIAAQTDQGLVVPVVHHAEALDLWGSAAQIRRLADASRKGRASREELSGSTITISSLGPMGGIMSTPVINAPEVAIVGVNKMVERPVFKNGVVVPRLMMNLSSSFDHRIVDGWDAASFIQAIKACLEHPATLFL